MAIRFKVTFRGEDLGVFDSDEITMDQALTLENKTGMSVQEMIFHGNRGSAKGMQAVIWFRLFQLGREQDLHTNFKFKDFEVEPIPDPDEEDTADPTDAADPVAELERVFEKSGTSTSRS